jgi:hypothetical protein
MGQWFSKRLESLLDNAIFAILLGIGVAVWGLVKSLSAPVIFVITLVTIAAILGILRLLRSGLLKQRQSKSIIEFYRTREELTRARGKMETELKGAAKVWIATWTGKYFRSENLFEKHHVDKLLLIDPTGNSVKSHIKITGEDEQDFANEIILTSKAAKRSDTIIHFADFPLMDSVIIVDKKRFEDENEFTDEAWARVETALPFRTPNNCPNFVVYKNKDPQLFQELVQHYCIIWNMGTEEPTPQFKTEAYPASNKLTLVIKAIAEAKLGTPKDKDTTVYISHANGLTQIYPEELKTILLKLQDDEKVLELKSFPGWLLSSGKYNEKKFNQNILAAIEPSRNKFAVRTFKKFEKFASEITGYR